MNFPGFFGSFMNRSPFSGRDCVEIEADPSADLFDRLIPLYCITRHIQYSCIVYLNGDRRPMIHENALFLTTHHVSIAILYSFSLPYIEKFVKLFVNHEFENFFHHSAPLHPYVEHGNVLCDSFVRL